MASQFVPHGMNESQLQLFTDSIGTRLQAKLQQQVSKYSQHFADAIEQHIRRIVAEEIDALSQKFRNVSGSPSPPPPYEAQDVASHVEDRASRCRRYLILPVPLPPTTLLSQGNLLSNLRSTPYAMLRQALSSSDLTEVLRQRGTPSTYLPLRGVAVCPVVDRARNFGRALRVARAFDRVIRIAMKAFSHLVKDSGFGYLLERPAARFMLSLLLERECANFGVTPVFVNRADLYNLRVRRPTQYIGKICSSEEGIVQFTNSLRVPTVFAANHSGALIRQSMSVGTYIAPTARSVVSRRTVATRYSSRLSSG